MRTTEEILKELEDTIGEGGMELLEQYSTRKLKGKYNIPTIKIDWKGFMKEARLIDKHKKLKGGK